MRSGILAARGRMALVCALLFALALAGCGAEGAQPGVSSAAGPDGPPVEEEGSYGAAPEPEAGTSSSMRPLRRAAPAGCSPRATGTTASASPTTAAKR